jgi:hypothetical protein
VIKKVLRGRASNFFPPCDFFYCVFGRFSIRGTQKRDKKNHVVVRVQKLSPGQIKYVRTLVVFFFFFLSPLVFVSLCFSGGARFLVYRVFYNLLQPACLFYMLDYLGAQGQGRASARSEDTRGRRGGRLPPNPTPTPPTPPRHLACCFFFFLESSSSHTCCKSASCSQTARILIGDPCHHQLRRHP